MAAEEIKEEGVIVGKDPVSGNEIPLGSSAKEVRDDIPVNLSENEYVIPADVVRYFGVGHFEKLISKAKKGFAEMAEQGRMGESTKEDAPEEGLPFSVEELSYEDDGEEEPVAEMANGGPVPPASAPPYNPDLSIPDSPFWQQGVSQGTSNVVENRTYINNEGERRVIMFIDGRPVQQVPEGFVPDTQASRDQIAEDLQTGQEELKKKEETDRRTGADTDLGKTSKVEAPDIDWAGMTPEERVAEVNRGRKAASVAGLFAGAATGTGPLAGAGIKAVLNNEYAKTMAEAGLSEAEIDKALGREEGEDGSIGSRIGSGIRDLLGFDAKPSATRTRTRTPTRTDDTLRSSEGVEISRDLLGDVQDAVDAAGRSSGSERDDDDNDSGDTSGGRSGSSRGEDRNKGGLVGKKTSKRKARRQKGKAKGLGAKGR